MSDWRLFLAGAAVTIGVLLFVVGVVGLSQSLMAP